MSEIGIFLFGSVMFIITAWATFAFGLSRVDELLKKDLDRSPRVVEVRSEGLTEVYVTQAVDDEPRELAAS